MTDEHPAHALSAITRQGDAVTQPDPRPCPDGAALVIKGEHFPCDQMRHMAPSCDSHDGWAHANSDAEAIWE